MRIGIGFSGVPFTVAEIAEFVRNAERARFHSAWFAEDYYLRDVITMMSWAAASTEHILLSTGIISPFTRNPVLIAETLATLDEVSHGRAQLAIGTGVASLVKRMGVEVERPVRAIEESCHIIQKLLLGKEVTYNGSIFQTDRVRLGDNPYSMMLGQFRPRRPKMPIYIAAIGPKMLQLAGRIADGVLLSVGCSADFVRNTVRVNLGLGAQAANRNHKRIDVAAYILTGLDSRDEEIVKSFLVFELAYSTPERLKALNVDEREAERLKQRMEQAGLRSATRLISQDVLHNLSACGKPERMREKVQEYIESGVSHPVLCPTTRNPTNVKKIVNAFSRLK